MRPVSYTTNAYTLTFELRFDTLPPCDYLKKVQFFREMYVELRVQDHTYLNASRNVEQKSALTHFIKNELVNYRTE